MHIHILGICGTFMGGVAQLAAHAEHTVTGCDANVYPPMSDQLKLAGIELTQGYGAEQMAVKPDLWVIGNAVSRGNPLLEAILDAGAPLHLGPAVDVRKHSSGAARDCRCRHPRQNHDHLNGGKDSRLRGA